MQFLWSLFTRKPALRQFALLDLQGRCQAFKECSQPPVGEGWVEIDASPRAGPCPCQPTRGAGVAPAGVGRLTKCLIKVIKHAHFPDVLRYNLPPIIRTSPDRASQHR
jgi:hypothetical protein